MNLIVVRTHPPPGLLLPVTHGITNSMLQRLDFCPLVWWWWWCGSGSGGGVCGAVLCSAVWGGAACRSLSQAPLCCQNIDCCSTAALARLQGPLIVILLCSQPSCGRRAEGASEEWWAGGDNGTRFLAVAGPVPRVALPLTLQGADEAVSAVR
ncbi:hypothetical protein E2C01_025058 [Portunus trituberculatus]|uniref:Uncharacterized protein n=1 Tax=Portunus trituberculatus TaxID=210409 RepID=A0A5B7EC67_PORTR|nr:hypothetical protein [Portunus trituberculatus]